MNTHLLPRKILRGNGDRFSLTFDNEEISKTGIVFKDPINIDGCAIRLLVHKKVEYRCHELVFSVEGEIPSPESGVVYFQISPEDTDVPPGTYWYSLLIRKPNGVESLTLSAKYIIARSLNPYYSIYENKM